MHTFLDRGRYWLRMFDLPQGWNDCVFCDMKHHPCRNVRPAILIIKGNWKMRNEENEKYEGISKLTLQFS